MATPGEQQLAPVEERSKYQSFVDRITTQVIAAMPLTVPDADLKRARARFRVAFSADAQGALQECAPESVARAIVMSAMSGLYPGGPRPDVWLIPRRNKHAGNRLECNWQMSFRGYIRLARRAGWELEPVLVFEGEKFEIMEGNQPAITHVRNLDLPKTWETLRYGYIRVFPTGQRDAARFAYLTKPEIVKRRGKAQDQNIWNEWPLEMVYKTLCHYAGNRELFPTDDPARYAMAQSEQSEIGGGSAETWAALPAGSKTANLAQRLAAPAAQEQAIEVTGRPLDVVEVEEDLSGGDLFSEAKAPPPAGPGARLSPAQVKEVSNLAGKAGVSIGEVEEGYGCRLAEIEVPGLDSAQLEAQLVREIRERAKK